MAYKKTLWNDNDVPYIDAQCLNHMENGIQNLLRKDGGVMSGALLYQFKNAAYDDEVVPKKYAEKYCVDCISNLPFGALPIFDNARE